MGMAERRRMHAARDQAGDVRHVDHEIGADGVRNLTETGEIDDPWVGRPTGDDQSRLVLPGERFDFVKIDQGIGATNAILHRVEPLAGNVRPCAMGQVTACRERHAHDGLTRFHQGQEDRFVRLRTGMRLHIGVPAAEQRLHALDRDPLGYIDMLAAAIIAATGITFGVFVRQDRSRRFQDGLADDVFRRDQFDLVLLPSALGGQCGEKVWVGLRQIIGEVAFQIRFLYIGRLLEHGFEIFLVARRAEQAPQDIFATRRAWRGFASPSKAVSRKTWTQSCATSGPIVRAPSAKTLASLCWRASRASVVS